MSQTPQQPQLDMGRVAQRSSEIAAAASAGAVAELASQLAMTQEAAHGHAERAQLLEAELEQTRAELARLRATVEMMQATPGDPAEGDAAPAGAASGGD